MLTKTTAPWIIGFMICLWVMNKILFLMIAIVGLKHLDEIYHLNIFNKLNRAMTNYKYHTKRITAHGNWEEVSPELGDLLVFVRPDGYEHWAVYAGDGEVIEYSNTEAEVGKRGKHATSIIRRNLDVVINGCRWYINNSHDRVWHPYSGERVVRRAESKIGEGRNQYNFVFNNCEGFANWARYNKPISYQAVGGITGASGLTGAAIGTAIAPGIGTAAGYCVGALAGAMGTMGTTMTKTSWQNE